jgi:hypothetical protein
MGGRAHSTGAVASPLHVEAPLVGGWHAGTPATIAGFHGLESLQ